MFKKIGDYGKRLVDLHLLKSPELDPPIAKFQGKGDNLVKKVAYDKKTARVYINKAQYFEEVEEKVWGYQIGGYQVPYKWLKDRKGRRLSADDIKLYCQIITALKKTIEIQQAIDNIYQEVEKETIEFQEISKNR